MKTNIKPFPVQKCCAGIIRLTFHDLMLLSGTSSAGVDREQGSSSSFRVPGLTPYRHFLQLVGPRQRLLMFSVKHFIFDLVVATSFPPPRHHPPQSLTSPSRQDVRTQHPQFSLSDTTDSRIQEHHHFHPLLTDNLLRLLPRSRPLQCTPQRLRESLGSMVRIHAERRARHGNHVLHDARDRVLRALCPLDDRG